MNNNYNLTIVNSTDEDVKKVVEGVVNDLKIFLKMPKDAPIYINNDFTTESENTYGETDFSIQPKVRKIEVTYDEDDDDFEDNSVTFGYNEYLPVFNDTELNVKVLPVFKTFKYALTIEISLKSKVMASTIINKIKTQEAIIRKNFRHNNIPSVFFMDNRVIYLLASLVDCRKPVYPNDTLKDYLAKYGDKKILRIVNSGGDNKKNILAMAFNFSNITGNLTTEAKGLKAEKDTENNDYKITLTYDVRFDRVIETNLIYPSMIFNKRIPKDLIQNIDPYKHYVGDCYYIDEFDKFTRVKRDLYTDKSNLYVTIPAWDTEILEPNGKDFKIIFTALLALPTFDPLLPVCNLKELGSKVKLQDDILAFLKDEHSFLLGLFKSVFYITLYENNKIVHNDYLRIDEDLNLYIVNRPVDLKNIYRVSFNICVNPNAITRAAYDRLLANELIVNKVNNIIVVNDVYNYDLYRSGVGDFSTPNRSEFVGMRTVQTVSIQAYGALELIGE